MSDFNNVKPAWCCLVSTSVRYGMTYGSRRSGFDPGSSDHDRIYCYFRLGTDVVVMARVRYANVVDFCGGANISSPEVTIYTRHPDAWDNVIMGTHSGSGRLEWDSDAHMAIPDMAKDYERAGLPYDDDYFEDYALYSLASAIACMMRDNERAGLMGCDRTPEEYGGSRIHKIMNTLAQVDTIYPALVYRPCVEEDENRDSEVRVNALGTTTSFSIDAELSWQEFHNRNSGNDVANYTLVGAHGVFQSTECEDGFYEEDEDGYEEWIECGECPTCVCNATANLRACNETVRKFYGGLFAEVMPPEYWYCG